MIPTKMKARKLSQVKADDIRKLYNNGNGESISQLAAKFDVHTKTVIDAITGKHWKLAPAPNQVIPLMPTTPLEELDYKLEPSYLIETERKPYDNTSHEINKLLQTQLTEQLAKITAQEKTINTQRRVIADQAIEIQQLREKANEHRSYA